MFIIEAFDLSKIINNSEILKNISLKIKKGTFNTFIGPSGAGKTTLLNILGLMDSFKGKLLCLNKDVQSLSLKEKAVFRNNHIGFLFQSSLLIPELTIAENIILPTFLNKKNKLKPDKILNFVGLNNKKNSYPSELSSGELQRVALARACVNKPEIIIADEPTGSLDLKNKQLILDFLKDYSSQFNSTIIIASHDELTKEYSDNIFNIHDGSLNCL